jgi:methionyl aminopeptidase
MPRSTRNDNKVKSIAIAGNIIFQIFSKIDRMDLEHMTTLELNDIIDTMIRERSATPTFLQYQGFPKSACISLNHEVVHGIPDDRRIKQGDLVKIDVGVTYQGFIADAAKTFAVGLLSKSEKTLLDVTRLALKKGIDMAQKGNRISDISRAVQTTVETHNFSVVRELTGHGVGEALHEAPMIPNFVTTGYDPEITPGMVLAIEPMVNMGSHEVFTEQNGWTVSTRDGSPSCHFEDTVAVLEKGNMNLTRVVDK